MVTIAKWDAEGVLTSPERIVRPISKLLCKMMTQRCSRSR